MRARSFVLVGLLASFFVASALPSAAGDEGPLLRAGLFLNLPTSDLSTDGQTVELDDSVGFQGSVEFAVTDRFGVEPGLGYAQHDITISEAGFPDRTWETDWLAVTVNGNFHLLEGGEIDLYVGPTLGYVFWGSVDTDIFDNFSADDDFLFGANVGIDVPLGDGPWGVSGAVRYLFTDLALEGASQDIGVDPIQLKVSVSYRF